MIENVSTTSKATYDATCLVRGCNNPRPEHGGICPQCKQAREADKETRQLCQNFCINYRQSAGHQYCFACEQKFKKEKLQKKEKEATLKKQKEEARLARAKQHTNKWLKEVIGDKASLDWSDYKLGLQPHLKRHIIAMQQKKGELEGAFFFSGRNGTGKTLLASLVLKDCFSSGRIRYDREASYKQFYMTAYSIRQSEFASVESYKNSFQRHITKSKVLVVDELEKGHLSGEYFSSLMYDLVNYRLDMHPKGKLTIFISNKSLAHAKERLAFLRNNRDVLFAEMTFTGESQRRQAVLPAEVR